MIVVSRSQFKQALERERTILKDNNGVLGFFRESDDVQVCYHLPLEIEPDETMKYAFAFTRENINKVYEDPS